MLRVNAATKVNVFVVNNSTPNVTDSSHWLQNKENQKIKKSRWLWNCTIFKKVFTMRVCD